MTPEAGRACPPIERYSRDELTSAADAVEAVAPDHPIIARFIADYGALRDKARACKTELEE